MLQKLYLIFIYKIYKKKKNINYKIKNDEAQTVRGGSTSLEVCD